MPYFELSEDQLVEELAEIQRLARKILETGKIEPYSETNHATACKDLLTKVVKLARKGDVV